MWFDPKRFEWPVLSPEENMRRLVLPEGRLDMVLDTDTYNEVDDQFALSYALLSPERLNVQAVYAAPFLNSRSTDAADGMEKSYCEIVRLLEKLGRPPEGFVFRGSDSFMRQPDHPVVSEAANDLVARARVHDAGNPLVVVAIGAITNVASALLMAPDIVERIAVVWLGGQPTSYPTAREFNLSQDLHAARTVLDCGVALHLIPCLGVASHLLTTPAELERFIGGKNALCDALIELFSAYSSDHFAWAKEIWDVAAIAYLIDPDWLPSKITHSPLLTDDSAWGHDERRHLIREAYFCKRNPVFRDMMTKLAAFTGAMEEHA